MEEDAESEKVTAVLIGLTMYHYDGKHLNRIGPPKDSYKLWNSTPYFHPEISELYLPCHLLESVSRARIEYPIQQLVLDQFSR